MFYICDIYLRKLHETIHIVDFLMAIIIRAFMLPMCFTALQAPGIFISNVDRGQGIRNFIFILLLVKLVLFLELSFVWGPGCLDLRFFKSDNLAHHFFLIIYDAIHGGL
jgi:choline-glycine betaine transporter